MSQKTLFHIFSHANGWTYLYMYVLQKNTYIKMHIFSVVSETLKRTKAHS